ncbi:hypothetical protein V493_00129 [Pseudogymnoascus sp. VKM F-4281 (FW-2241)]|nr:hypothetical protein V493_00129 [Pseudogymnoascus sp. VKM F-4281 (FW-2241)]
MAIESIAQTGTSNDSQEKNFSQNGYTSTVDTDANLEQIRTANSISISPELFEKIYLSPQNAVRGDLRKTFGNPTPVCLLGFLLSLSPLSCDLMGWRGAGGYGAAGIGAYYFFGGLLMILGGIFEFILGNTFPFVVFCSFGAFWLTFAATLQPSYYAYGLYAPEGAASAADGISTVGFQSSFAFFLVFVAVMCFIYLICSLRTNIIFVTIFFTLVLGFSLLSGSFWQTANGIGNADPRALALGHGLQIASGACFFVTCMAGWYMFFAIMLEELDFPFQIPVGDLSTLIMGASQKKKAKENMV